MEIWSSVTDPRLTHRLSDYERYVHSAPEKKEWSSHNWRRKIRFLQRRSKMEQENEENICTGEGNIVAGLVDRGGRCLLFLNDAMFSNS